MDSPIRQAPFAPARCASFALIASPDIHRVSDDIRRRAQAAVSPRIIIKAITPAVDDGAFPVKRLQGERVTFRQSIFTDGHDELAAELLWRAEGGDWHRVPMQKLANDRWQARIYPAAGRPSRIHRRGVVGRMGHFPPRSANESTPPVWISRRSSTKDASCCVNLAERATADARAVDRSNPARPADRGRLCPIRASALRTGAAICRRRRSPCLPGAARAGDPARRRPSAGRIRKLVRAVPAVCHQRPRSGTERSPMSSNDCPASARWDLTCSISRRSIRSA